MKTNNIRKIIVFLMIIMLCLSDSNFAYAMTPPAFSVLGRRDNVVMKDNAMLYMKCENYTRNIYEISISIYESEEYGKKGRKISQVEKKTDMLSKIVYASVNVNKDMGIKLESGKLYYLDYEAMCKSNSKPTDYRNGIYIATPDTNINSNVVSTSEDNSIINMKYKGNDDVVKAGIRVTCDGCVVGTVEKDLTNKSNDSQITFDLKEDGKMNLLPNSNYRYNTYLITKSKLGYRNNGRVDSYGTFKTLENSKINNIFYKTTKKNLNFYGKLNNPQKHSIEKYGIIIKKGNKIIGKFEKTSLDSEKNVTTKQLSFNGKKDIKNLKLIKGKKYKYEIYAYVNGKKISKVGKIKLRKTIK